MEKERLFSIKRVLDLSEEDVWVVLGLGCNHFFNVLDGALVGAHAEVDRHIALP